MDNSNKTKPRMFTERDLRNP